MRAPRLTRTASFRLAGLYALLFAASAVILGAVVFWITRAALEQQLTARIETEIAFLRDEYRAGGLARLVDDVTVRERGASGLDYLVQAADGARLAGEMPALGARRGWLDVEPGAMTEDGDSPEPLRAFAVTLPGGVAIAVGDDLGRIADAEEAILTAFAWAVVATVLLAVGGGAWLSGAFLRRVDAIARTAEAIIGGDLARRIPIHGAGDELDRLAATLNRMLDRVGALMDSLRQVSNDIAHDLRTPLSRLRQRLEGARRHAGALPEASSVPEYEAAIDAAIAEAEELLGTFSALLRIAQVEAGAQRAAFAPVDLSGLADTVLDAFTPAAEDADHPLSGDIAPGVEVFGDRELLTQLLVNLVENALRHTPPGTPVRVRVTPGHLIVEDGGPGVPAAERARVLQRFYRSEQSRTTPGNGLGLSLVAAVAELHGASLTMEDAGPGLRVAIAFPR